MTKITDAKGHEIDSDIAAHLMDDDLREELHDREDWASEQAFFDAYVKAHEEKFGEPFTVN